MCRALICWLRFKLRASFTGCVAAEFAELFSCALTPRPFILVNYIQRGHVSEGSFLCKQATIFMQHIHAIQVGFLIILQETSYSKLAMSRQIAQSTLSRVARTSEPRFKRLPHLVTSQCSSSTTTLHKATATCSKNLDSAKENLFYETHLLKVKSACKLDESAIVGKCLGAIRKDYDLMAKEAGREMTALRLRRKDIDFLKGRNRAMEQQRKEVEVLIASRETEVAAMRERFEEAGMQTKTLQNIIARMKKDEIYYKKFARIRDEELRRKTKEHKLLEEKLIHQEEKLQRLHDTREECRAAYDRNKHLRQQKLTDFSGGISDVREREEFLSQRRARTYELQSIELNDTLDEKNIHMRQITLAHKVADSLLQGKVAKLIQSYAYVQDAFHLVKAKTAISEPQLLTAKFLSYEHTAQALLESIAHHEQRIQQLTARKTALTNKYQQILNEGLAITECRETSGKYDHSNTHQKEACAKVTNAKMLLADEISQWIDRRLLEFHFDKSLKGVSIENKFKELCLATSLSIKKCESIDWKGVLGGKKGKRQTTGDEASLLANDASELNQSNVLQEQCIRSSRQGAKKGFSIKHFKRESTNPSIK